ncbi:hypothetical protein PFX98_19560 [Paucibacter sediminis]|uniref:Uncharacterized protein n=1 Tax=Paucibacter sediminis TaxID=3019553 RepID=A0AA95N9V3_9BURK|nr:hypothetical protein [Paucibacter sp. S2-9]WIT11082.1 hypothetical protein PFX98_19560 [Paucibacter sp. S2-9]
MSNLISDMNVGRLLAIFALLINQSVYALAGECLERTWEGTVGGLPVTMRFETIYPDDKLAGRYYYSENVNDLLLMPLGEQSGRWAEIDPMGRQTGVLTLSCTEARLSGEWKSGDGRRRLPVLARARAGLDYQARRMAALRWSVLAVPEPNGEGRDLLQPFGLEALGVTGLRLHGHSVGVRTINAKLMAEFRDAVQVALECRTTGRLTQGEGHTYENRRTWSVETRNRGFVVVVQTSSDFCGQAHPYLDVEHTVFEASRGEIVRMADWLSEPYQDELGPKSELGKLLHGLYRHGGDASCFEEIAFTTSDMWPSESGLHFRTIAPYESRRCIETFLLPFDSVWPYLSSIGKVASKAFVVQH